jgi:hypothetical protein
MLLIPLILFVSPATSAGDLNVFELNDGTAVIGTVTAYQDGVFSVSSPSLGTVRIPESEIRVMRKKGGPNPVSPARSVPDIESLQQSILADPEFARSLSSLAEDPSVQSLLGDPDLRRALESGDYDAMMNAPEFQQLLNHPEIQKMTQEILRQMQ